MRYSDRYSLESIVFGTLAVMMFIFIRFLFTPTGKILLASVIVLTVCYFLVKCFFLGSIYENFSTNVVPKQFVINKLTLRNDSCTVMLTPGEKIVVMDNDYIVDDSKRMFVITKKDLKTGISWNRICRIFNESSNLDSLAAFFTIDINVNIVIFDKRKHSKCSDIQKNINIASVEAEQKQDFIDINASGDNSDNSEAKFSEDFAAGKINVNSASADEIAILPGINIVGAKKIIEYRNLNGPFKSVEEFIKAAGVKEHFAAKIREMVIAGDMAAVKNENDESAGRIVDF